MAQKAIEMGARRLRPIITRRTQASRVNLERLKANAIEACEQCGVIWTPDIAPVETLDQALAHWPKDRLLVFCDEEAPQASPLDALARAKADGGVSLLVGPEGGFDEAERAAILATPGALRLSLGPRILRADTAAVAALDPHPGDAGRLAEKPPRRGIRIPTARRRRRHVPATMSFHFRAA